MPQNNLEQPAQGEIQEHSQESSPETYSHSPEQINFEAKSQAKPKKRKTPAKTQKKRKPPKPKKPQVTEEEANSDNPYIQMVFNSAFINKAQSKILAPDMARQIEQALLYRAKTMQEQTD